MTIERNSHSGVRIIKVDTQSMLQAMRSGQREHLTPATLEMNPSGSSLIRKISSHRADNKVPQN